MPRHYPKVTSAWFWLAEMFHRKQNGIPAVSTPEFDNRANWFHANGARLYRLPLPSQQLDLGEGRKTANADLRWRIRKGPKARHSGELAEDLRQRRAMTEAKLRK